MSIHDLTPPKEPFLVRKWREWPAWNRWLVAIAGALLIATILTPKNKPVQLTPEQARTEMIEQHFSALNGAHEGVQALVKSQLKDPDSFEHVKTQYWDKGDHLIVNMSYRANNSMGVPVAGFIKAKTDLKGNVLAVLEQR